MEDLIKKIIELQKQGNMTAEEITRRLYEIYHEDNSEVDKWYQVGDAFWLRRSTATDYMSVQVFPLVDDSYLCYLHILNTGDYEESQVERYNENVSEIPSGFPPDIKYIYPIAVSQDIESAKEMFLATTSVLRDEWLNKMGIRRTEE